MNGPEQVARFSATQRLEARVADLEIVVTQGLAADIVRHHAEITQDLQVFNERLRVYAEREAERVNQDIDGCHRRLTIFMGMTLWQRLRWVVGL